MTSISLVPFPPQGNIKEGEYRVNGRGILKQNGLLMAGLRAIEEKAFDASFVVYFGCK
jgi:hypothetical protein